MSALNGRRILVVEDEFHIALLLEALLEEFGCEVVGPVATTDEALAILREEPLDGALLDVNLKGVISAPVAEALCRSSIPFVVVTGYGELMRDYEALNNAPRLGKPFTKEGLAEALAAALKQPN